MIQQRWKAAAAHAARDALRTAAAFTEQGREPVSERVCTDSISSYSISTNINFVHLLPLACSYT